ncbi:MAG TPA: preprotein translocase subunit SecG [Rectinemataceae bacterium]|nr:preprotein translocase subunit SecG [Rectinemataceae bacterium]
MGILSIVLLVIFVIVALLLVLMVIIQDSDSDSLGGLFAGGSSSAFGSRSTSVVVRFTYVLGALFFVVAFGLAILNKSSVGNVEAAAQQKNQSTPTEWWNVQPKSANPGLPGAEQVPPAQTPATPVPTPGK